MPTEHQAIPSLSKEITSFVPKQISEELIPSLLLALERKIIERIQASVADQLELELPPVGKRVTPSCPIEHRLQQGPTCGLEAIHRALAALGFRIDADKVITLGLKRGFSQGLPIILMPCLIADLGLNAEAFYYPNNFIPFEKNKITKYLPHTYDVYDSSLYPLRDRLSQRAKTPLFLAETTDEELKRKATEWLSFLDDGEVLILSIANPNSFWMVSKKESLLVADNSPHAIALVSYSIDAQHRLSFEIYDSSFATAPFFVGPKYLTKESRPHYVRIRIKNKLSSDGLHVDQKL